MKKESLSHLSNLIALAFADGRLDIKEKKLIMSIGSKMGFSQKELQLKLDHPQEVDFVYPEKETARYNQLYELLSMIMIDGHIHDKEVILLKKYARKLNFADHIVDPLILKIKEFLNKGYNQNKMQSDLNNLINKI